MGKKIRTAIIGCGGISRGHIRNFLSIPEVELVALVEPAEKMVERIQREFPDVKGLPLYSDYKEMLKKDKPDAVQINSPHNVHFDQIMDSLDAGCHVLSEKPMVCSVKHALKVIDKSKKKKKVVGISYQRHSGPVYQYVRNQLRAGAIGEIQYVTAFQGQDWLRGTRGAWRQVKEVSCGGQLNDSGSHLVDIVLWMTDLVPVEVSATCRNFDAEVDINSTVSVLFENGAQGTFSVVGNYPGGFSELTRVIGDEGAYHILDFGGGLLLDKRGERHHIEGLRGGAPSCDHNFVDAILGNSEILAPPVCGLNVMKLTEAAWRSAEEGRSVKVKELSA